MKLLQLQRAHEISVFSQFSTCRSTQHEAELHLLGRLSRRNAASHQEQTPFDKVGSSKIVFMVFFCLRHLSFAANIIYRTDDGNSTERGLLTAFPTPFFLASCHSHQHSVREKNPLYRKLLCCPFAKLTCTGMVTALEEEGD